MSSSTPFEVREAHAAAISTDLEYELEVGPAHARERDALITGRCGSRRRDGRGLHEASLRYGTIDVDRIYAVASAEIEDLVAFCRVLARRAREQAER